MRDTNKQMETYLICFNTHRCLSLSEENILYFTYFLQHASSITNADCMMFSVSDTMGHNLGFLWIGLMALLLSFQFLQSKLS